MSRPYVGTSLLAGNLSALPGTRILLRFNLIMRLSFGGNFLFGRKSPGIARNHFTQILAKNSILRAMCAANGRSHASQMMSPDEYALTA